MVKTLSYVLTTGELAGMVYADEAAPAQAFTYTLTGKLASVTDAAETRAFSYNEYDELVSDRLTADEIPHLITENRDSLGRSIGFAYSKAGVAASAEQYGYGTDGRLVTAAFAHGGENKQFGYAYLPGTHLLQTLTMPNGMTLTQQYETQRDLLTGMEYKRGTSGVVERYYSYDALGRPLTRRQNRQGGSRNDAFTHNDRSELTAATLGNTEYTYSYDNIGNRKTAQENAEEATAYTANQLNQYTAVGSFAPSYDADGNQTRVQTSSGIWEVTYNAENRPTQFTRSNADETTTRVTCTYDYMGRRATKKVETLNADTTASTNLHQRYLYHGYLQIACCDLMRESHPNLWLITWDPSQPIATRPLALRKDGTWYCYGWDLTKNICEVFSNEGYLNNTVTYSYTPYGAVTAEGSVAQPIQWSSEFYDEELGLVYYNYRHYNPAEGKWITRDNILDDFNLYRACKNNSLNGCDIKGEWFWVAIPLVMYGIGVANAPGIYDNPTPKGDPNLGRAIIIDVISGITVAGFLKLGGFLVAEIKFTLYRTKARWTHNLAENISEAQKTRARASSVAFDARTGRSEIGTSGKMKGEIIRDSHETLNNLIKEACDKIPNNERLRYPIGNCAEADAVNKLLKKGSIISDIRIDKTYAIPETIKRMNKQIGKDPVTMKPCKYCEIMFKTNLHQRGVKIETPKIYILPGSSYYTEATKLTTDQ